MKKPIRIKALQKVFNKFIRTRDCAGDSGGNCISCGKWFPFEELEAGHYFTTGSAPSLRFNEKNVNIQCTGCNKWRSGNLAFYSAALIRKYGKDIITELRAEVSKELPSSSEMYELEKHYKQQIENFTNE